MTRCGCSVAEYDQKPIAPGASTKIKITVDTKGMIGKQVKSVTVVANSFPRNKRLVLTSEVLKK